MREYIPALTGVRAIAAFTVVIHHLVKTDNTYLASVLRELNFGVNIFFVLSGFLIYHRYANQVSLKKFWLKTYLINRVARIYPLYFFWTTVVMILSFIAHNQSVNTFLFEYFLNITFLKGLSSQFVYSGIAQGWTLSVEELFYISAPLVFFLHLRKKIPLVVLGLSIALIGFILFKLFKNLDFYGFLDNYQHIKITTFFGRFYEFFAGMVLAKFVHKQTNKQTNRKKTNHICCINLFRGIHVSTIHFCNTANVSKQRTTLLNTNHLRLSF